MDKLWEIFDDIDYKICLIRRRPHPRDLPMKPQREARLQRAEELALASQFSSKTSSPD